MRSSNIFFVFASKLIISFCFLFVSFASHGNESIVIGSKLFSENYILAETFAQLLEDRGYSVTRKFSIGGTMAAFYALENHEIDIYPEYSGTIAQVILKSDISDFESLNSRLRPIGLDMLKPLGFNNSYCLVMKESQALALHIKSISDLSNHSELRGAISFEFQDRKDGWIGLRETYKLKNKLINLNVPLNYEALLADKVDFSEAYTTEPLVEKYSFIILEDDKNFFPQYLAVPFVHKGVSKKVRRILNELANKVDDATIRSLTGKVNSGMDIPQVAQHFLLQKHLISKDTQRINKIGIQWGRMWEQTQTHLFLTGFAVLLAALFAVPLGTFISGRKKLSQITLGITGVLQTIPSIALLTFMIPFFGIGFTPAMVGLFIYSLLPILRNTHTAMTGIDPRLLTSARGIGLYPSEIFFSVKLPLAFPTILAGIRTATILNIGTATLAAFIGAGGLGVPIVTGLALNDTGLVLQGAIPAAILAIVIDLCFSLADRIFTKNI